MNRFPMAPVSIAALAGFLLAACDGAKRGEAPVEPAALTKPAAQAIPTSPGKPTAPISIDYSIMGNPVVGQPVGISVQVSSPLNDRPITLSYKVNEIGSMTFPPSQAQKVSLLPLADATVRAQQVTVVPQREGRLFLVVSAEIETDGGTMIRTMSIPMSVGRASRDSGVNGALVEGPDGEAGISLPARQDAEAADPR